MGISDGLLKQFRKPTGGLGRLVGRGMNLGHGKLRKWGLGHVAIDPGAVVLDVGCGGGKTVQVLARIARGGKVYGIDFSEEMVQLARKVNKNFISEGQVEIVHGTVSSMPFPGETFDMVTTFESHYFWPSLVDDLREIRRVLKPGGRLLIVGEMYKDEDNEKFEKRNTRYIKGAGISNYCTPEESRGHLAEAGYVDVEVLTIPEKNWIMAVGRKQSDAP